MPSYHATVKCKVKGPGFSTTWTGPVSNVQGKTESALMEELRKKFKGKSITILSIKWK